MKNFIPVKKYKKVNSITFGNMSDNSRNGHNYYMGFGDPKDIILESINCEGIYVYDRINSLCKMGETVLTISNMIGFHKSSIFDTNCSDTDEFGFVMVEY